MAKLNKLTTVTKESNVSGGIVIKPGIIDRLVSPTNNPVYEYGEDIQYVTGDLALLKINKKYVIYEAIKDTTGVYDATAWKEYSLADKLGNVQTTLETQISDVDAKVEDYNDSLGLRLDDVETVLGELTDTVFQDDEGLSKVTTMPTFEGVMFTDKYNPFVSLFERGIDKFKGVSLGGNVVPMSTDVTIDLGKAPESGVAYNLVFVEIFKVMTRTGVRINHRLRNVLLTEEEMLESKSNSRFLVPNTVNSLTKTSIKPNTVLGAEVTVDNTLGQDSTLFKYGSFLSVSDRTETTNVNQQTRLFDTELYIAGDGTFESKTALGTVDGYVYAIPLQYIKRRNSHPYSLFNKDGGSSYVESEVTLIDAKLKPNTVFPLTLAESSKVVLKASDIFFLGAPEENIKIQYTGTLDTYNRPLFTFLNLAEEKTLSSTDQMLYSYAKDAHYYNVIGSFDTESIVKGELGSNNSYSELLIAEFNKLMRGELKLSTREVVEYFGPDSYDADGDLQINHLITATDRYRTEWSNRPTYIEVERTISANPLENDSDITLNQAVTGAFQTGDTIKFNSKNIMAPPIDEALKLNGSEVVSLSGTTVTLSNTDLLSVGDNVNVVNPDTLEIVARNLVVSEVNETLKTIKISDASSIKEKYLILESSVTPYFIVSADQAKASWVEINTRNPLAKLMTPNITSTMTIDNKYVNKFEEFGIDLADATKLFEDISGEVPKMISTGGYHTLALKQDGSLWAWGSNSQGQLGDGTTTSKSVPTQIGTDKTWSSISCGGYHTVALKQDGSLWAWGYNNYGQLGDDTSGPSNSKLVPTQIGTDKTWSSIACGGNYTVALKQDGSLWAWGSNAYGQVGDGTTTNKSVPTQIGADKTWSSISCGGNHTVALKQDGSLWAWGYNGYGQLGDGTTTNKLVPTQIGTDKTWSSISAGGGHTIAIKQDGSLWAWGYNNNGELGDGTTTNKLAPTQIGTDKTWSSISGGDNHTVALKQDGSLWAWGYNQYGQLGDNTLTNKLVPIQIGTDKSWSSISSGNNHTIALKHDGSLWAWGSNSNGQLGDGASTNKSVPTEIIKGIINEGTGQYNVKIATGGIGLNNGRSSFIIKPDGSLWAWGYNRYGQLGDGTLTNTSVPTQIGTDKTWSSVSCGSYHTVALKQDGSLWAWGRNDNTQLGDGTTTNNKSVPTQIGTDKTWSSISCGADFNLAIKQDGSLWTWGSNAYGQLGDGTTATNKSVPTQIGTDKTWSSVSCGYIHTVALKQDGSLWAWGTNNLGQLGDGTTSNKSVPTQIGTDKTWSSITCGNGFTVALKQDGSLWAWGYNGYGQLGDGTTTNKLAPTQIGTDKTWSSISGGGYYTVALKQDGSLWAWGTNNLGQLGDGTTTDKSTPTQIGTDKTWLFADAHNTDGGLAIKKDGSVWSWGSNGNNNVGDGATITRTSPVQVLDLGTLETIVAKKGIKMIKSGSKHTVAIKQDGSLWSWGSNAQGQLGDGTTTQKTVPTQIGTDKSWSSITCGNGFTVAIKQDGSLWAWGYNINSQLVPTQIGTDKTWSSISCGTAHTIALKQDGSLWAWGANAYGQLGDGTTTNKSLPTQIGTDKTWASISCGVNHTVALKQDGSLWAWGFNNYSQLGDRATTNKLVPTQIGTDKTWSSISSGYGHTIAIKQDGSLWAWGYNVYGQLGDGTTTNKSVPTQIGTDKTWSSISCGSDYAVALKQDGSLWAWGYNAYGQLGDGTTDNKLVPTQIGTDKTWSSISSSYGHTIAIKQDGSLWSWGLNNSGQLGDDTSNNKLVPTEIISELTYGGDITTSVPSVTVQSMASSNATKAFIKSDGSLWVWGDNAKGQLGIGSTVNKLIPTKVGTASWKQVALGSGTIVAIQQDGSLWTAGSQSYGKLGNGSTATTSVTTLTKVGSATDWASVYSNGFTVYALKTNGTLWAWGYNSYGQIGNNSTTDVSTPTQIGAGTWKVVSPGDSFVVAIHTDGSLWAWGYNNNGQLGDGTTNNKSVPTRIGTDNDWKDVKSGTKTTVAQKEDGTLFGWGYNGRYSLLTGTSTDVTSVTPLNVTDVDKFDVAGSTVAVIKKDKSLWVWGDNAQGVAGTGVVTTNGGYHDTPVKVGLNNWDTIVGGYSEFIAMKTDKSVWTWGYNGSGELGNNRLTIAYQPVKIVSTMMVSTGNYCNAVIKQDGSLWAWGSNYYGQIGDGTTTSKSVPTQIGTDKSWSSISGGGYHTVTLKQDGSLWAWGRNNYGQLGDGTTTDKSVPTQIGTDKTWSSVSCGEYYTVALKQDSSLWAWGRNDKGQLGDGTNTNKSVPTQIGTDKTWSSIACGVNHTVAIKQDGSLWAWGYNYSGQLGDGTTTNKLVPTQIGTDKTWSSISCGSDYTVALKQDGTLWAWGVNNYGQLGDGTTTSRYVPTQIGTDKTWSSIASGGDYNIALKQDGTLWAWGSNSSGQLGDGTTTNKLVPTQIGTDKTWSSISGGYIHTVALKQDGYLWSWGSNSSSQLGNGTTTSNPAPNIISLTNKSYNKYSKFIPIRKGYITVNELTAEVYFTDYSGSKKLSSRDFDIVNRPIQGLYSIRKVVDNGKSVIILDGGGRIFASGLNTNGMLTVSDMGSISEPTMVHDDFVTKDIAMGIEHTVLIKSDGTLWSVGKSTYGQLGQDSTAGSLTLKQIGNDTDWVAVEATDYATIALKEDGTVYQWGGLQLTSFGAPADVSVKVPTAIQELEHVETIKAGSSHMAAITKENALYVWGHNQKGQLCNSVTTPKFSPLLVTLPNTVNTVKSVELGDMSTLIMSSDSQLYGAGANTYGQLLLDKETTITGMKMVRQTRNKNRKIKLIGSTLLIEGYDDLNNIYITGEMNANTIIGSKRISKVAMNKFNSAGHSFSIMSDGSLWAWGYNDRGQLGDGTTTSKTLPTQIGSEKKWSSITCGYDFTVAIKQDGTLWAWGYNNVGQLGDGTTTNRSVPTKIGTDKTWSSISCGASHTIAIKQDGSLWAWGYNGFGQVGDGTTTDKLTPTQIGTDKTWSYISGGSNHTIALKQDGSLWAWGNNNTGQLGDGTTSNKSVPTQIGTDKTWSSVTCGGSSGLAIKQDGTLWAWGYNGSGQLGDGTTTNKSVPTQIGSDKTWSSVSGAINHTVALKQGGSLWTWGNNANGQLGDGTTANKTVPTQIGTDKTWSSIVSCAVRGTMVLSSDKELLYSGINYDYNKVTTNKFMKTELQTFNKISVHRYHSLGLYNGNIYAWGKNSYGELGDGATTNTGIPILVRETGDFVDIATGNNFSIAIKNDGTVHVWGDITGDFSTVTDAVSVDVYDNYIVILASSGKLYDFLKGTDTALTLVNADSNWSKVAVGTSHTIALKTDGSLWGWGSNTSKQLSPLTGSNIAEPSQMGTATNWSHISAGATYSFFIDKDNKLYRNGSLTNGATYSNITLIDTAYKALNVFSHAKSSFVLDTNRALYVFGDNTSGQLGISDVSAENIKVLDYASEVFPGEAGVIVNTGDGYLAAGSSVYGILGNFKAYATSSTTPLTFKYRELLPAAEGIVSSTSASTSSITVVNGVEYTSNNDVIGFNVPLNLLEVSVLGSSYEAMNEANIPSAKFLRMKVKDVITNMLNDTDYTVTKAVINVDGVEQTASSITDNVPVFSVNALPLNKRFTAYVEVTLGSSFATSNGEVRFTPKTVRINNTTRDAVGELTQNILPNLTKYSNYVTAPASTDDGSGNVTYAAGSSVRATIYLDTTMVYKLVGTTTNTKVTITSPDNSSAIHTSNLSATETVLNLFTSTTDSVKGYKQVSITFSGIDTTKAFTMSKDLGIYAKFQSKLNAHAYEANAIDIVYREDGKHQVVAVDSNKLATVVEGAFNQATKTITVDSYPNNVDTTVVSTGLKLNLLDVIGDLTPAKIKEEIELIAFNLDINVASKAYKLKVRDFVSNTLHDVIKVGSSYIINVKGNSSAQYIDGDGSITLLVENQSPVKGDVFTIKIEDIRAYTATSEIAKETRHTPIIFVNSNGDIRTHKGLFNQFGKASNLGFVRDETIKLQPVTDETGLTVIYESDDVLITDVVSTNVGLVDHPFNNPLGLFNGLVIDNLVGVVGFQEARFEADSKYTNTLSNFKIQGNKLVGLSSQETRKDLSSPSIGLTKALVNTKDGLALMITTIPTNDGTFDTFAEGNNRYIIPLNMTIDSQVETFDYPTITKV